MSTTNFSNFNNRLKKYEESIKPQKFGEQWEKDKKNFKVEIKNGKFNNHGAWNFFPEIYDEDIKQSELIELKIDNNTSLSNNKFFYELGKTKICLKKNQGNKTLLFALNYFNIIEKYVNVGDIVCEVGSGSGLFTSIIQYQKKTTNILIDIPEVLFVSISLIFSLFPEKKILLPNEINNKTIFKNFDFIFLEPNQLEYLENDSVNFGINTQSFMEMDFQEVNDYLFFFNRVIKNEGYFFCSNRLRKRHYFFNYNFSFLRNYEKIFLRKDEIAYTRKNQACLLNILFQRNDDNKKTMKNFSLIEKFFGLFLFKHREFFYWFKRDIKVFFSKLLK